MLFPKACFPRIPWERVRPDYSHINDAWVRAELENIDRAAFEADQLIARMMYINEI